MGLFKLFRGITGRRPDVDESDIEKAKLDSLRLINEGNAMEEAGQLQEALRYYETAAQIAPDFARAHLNRGNILLAQGNPVAALDAYTTALTLEPDYAAAHYNTGNTYADLGRNKDALEAYRKAIQLKPEFVDAHVALACTHEDLGQLDDAVASYRRALEISPDYAEAHSNLGTTLRVLGRLEESLTCCRRALEINPEFADAHINLGHTLRALGQSVAATSSFRRAVELKPDSANAHFSLGITLSEQGQPEGAVSSLRTATVIDPNYVEAYINLGDSLRDIGRSDDAWVSYSRALEIDPEHAVAHNNMGNALLDRGQFDEAISRYRRATELKPDFAAAYSNLGVALKDVGQTLQSLDACRKALELAPKLNAAKSNLIFTYNLLADTPPSHLLAEARSYGAAVSSDAHPFTVWNNDPSPDRCLRIGFVSGDLRTHPVGQFIEGVLHALDSNAAGRLEIYAYTTYFSDDVVSQRIKAYCRYWYAVAGLSDEELAGLIHDDNIDVLIDLSGHTAHNRLPMFAWKPAPIQATWLGYLGTTGVDAIDYLIADAWTLPETEEPNFTEKIWRLPESYLCFTPPDVDTPVNSLPALTNGFVTFGCFNNLTKINDDVVALWSRVLKAVPNSRLLLKAKQFAQPSGQQSVQARFAANGIAADRLILIPQVSRSEYLAPYQQLDIALDPFPYPGITTSVESLWMGVPVLTLRGESFTSRQGVGLLMNAGLPSWIADSQDDYVARAKAHADDLAKLAAIRSDLRDRIVSSPIFDSHRFATHFESAMREMWKNWCHASVEVKHDEL